MAHTPAAPAASNSRAIHYPAVRAFLKLYLPIERALAYGAQADAGFDAGEWSAAAHDKIAAGEIDRIAKLVADAFGIDHSDLLADVNEAEMTESFMQCSAHLRRAARYS